MKINPFIPVLFAFLAACANLEDSPAETTGYQ